MYRNRPKIILRLLNNLARVALLHSRSHTDISVSVRHPRWRITQRIGTLAHLVPEKESSAPFAITFSNWGISWARPLIEKFGRNLSVSVRRHLALEKSVPQLTSCPRPLTAAFISSDAKITALSDFVNSLPDKSAMLAPDFFLASVSPRGWRPLVVVVSQGKRIAGLLYFKERVVAGIGIRFAFGNNALGAMVAAHPNEIEAVIDCGLNALLKRMIALRFLVHADQLPLLKRIRTDADVAFFPTKNHAHLQLPRTFDDFLAKLGPRTRRNFRNFRRKSEQTGNQFIQKLSFAEFSEASRSLLPNAALARSKETQEKHLAMIGTMPSQMLVGLRGKNSEWIGLAGGWIEDNRAILVMQLNDRTRTRESISLVLRSYLIEALINQGVREIIFWEGTSAPLSAYATYPEMFMAHLDAQSFALRLVRRAWTTARRLAPANFVPLLKWFVRDV